MGSTASEHCTPHTRTLLERTHTRTNTHSHAHMHTCRHTHTLIDTHNHIYLDSHKHTQTHAHTHTHCSDWWQCVCSHSTVLLQQYHCKCQTGDPQPTQAH